MEKYTAAKLQQRAIGDHRRPAAAVQKRALPKRPLALCTLPNSPLSPLAELSTRLLPFSSNFQ